jgi:hypothetical protein
MPRMRGLTTGLGQEEPKEEICFHLQSKILIPYFVHTSCGLQCMYAINSLSTVLAAVVPEADGLDNFRPA